MVHNCCVPYCHADSKRHKGLKFFVIPKDKSARKRWITRIRNETLRPHARVCSLHFTDGIKSYGEVPSIFPWTGQWDDVVNSYNDKSDAAYIMTAMAGESSAKQPAKLTLDKPAFSSKPGVKRAHRHVVHTSTPKKVWRSLPLTL